MSHIATSIQEFLKSKGSELSPEALAAVKEFFADRCVLIWGVGDVHHAAADVRRVLSDEEARNILAKVQRAHDCSIGVSWETFEAYCSDAGRPMTPEEARALDESSDCGEMAP